MYPDRRFVLLLLLGSATLADRGLRSQTVLRVPPPAAASAAPQVEADSVSPAFLVRQNVPMRATRALVRRGFANVASVIEGRRLFVAFENTRYRDERRALLDAAQHLLQEMESGQELVLVPTSRAVPLAVVRYAACSGAGPRPDGDLAWRPGRPLVSLSVSGVPPALLRAPRASSSFGRVEVAIHPWLDALFGNYDNPVALRIGVVPELRMAVRPGLSLSAQALVTLHDDLPSGESRVRPALVTLNQTVRLPRDVFISATAGIFIPNRYGVDLEARTYLRNGRWSIGAEAARTGTVSYAREGWSRSPVDASTLLADLAWRSSQYDLVLRATAGSFLGPEKGVRVDVVRQFGELEIGWFVLRSSRGTNGGAMLRLPLLPAKHAAPRPVQLRAGEAFRWEYRYRALIPGGRRFATGNALEDFGRGLNPDYVMASYE